MTKDLFNREADFRLSVAVFKALLSRGFLTEKEFEKAREMLAARFNPPYGSMKDLLAATAPVPI